MRRGSHFVVRKIIFQLIIEGSRKGKPAMCFADICLTLCTVHTLDWRKLLPAM